MKRASDTSIEQRARTLYQEAGRNLDPTTAGRLRAARRRALQAALDPAPLGIRALLPVGALAVAALAALIVWQPLQHGTSGNTAAGVHHAVSATDNELPPDPDSNIDPNLYQNLDFYSWLASTNAPPADTH
ncbi:hypothetical protein [Dyella sp. A6]|uniref:hypothetical protein n=1 Tax=Dyella aluminiiresistens TaxID=3069105 RepID=UPI002E791FE3|nr:hypothetical protein [Dyella sp. A6]